MDSWLVGWLGGWMGVGWLVGWLGQTERERDAGHEFIYRSINVGKGGGWVRHREMRATISHATQSVVADRERNVGLEFMCRSISGGKSLSWQSKSFSFEISLQFCLFSQSFVLNHLYTDAHC